MKRNKLLDVIYIQANNRIEENLKIDISYWGISFSINNDCKVEISFYQNFHRDLIKHLALTIFLHPYRRESYTLIGNKVTVVEEFYLNSRRLNFHEFLDLSNE